MRLLFYLIWFVLLMFGIYLRKKNIVKVPLWLEIFFICFVCFDFCSFILLCIVYPINKQNHSEKGDLWSY